MKILTISNTPWNENNSFGNSYSNIFDNFPDVEFANIYCNGGEISAPMVKKGFQITEKMLIKNMLHKESPAGAERDVSGSICEGRINESVEKTAKKLRWQIIYWARDMVWKIGRWKSPELLKFIEEYNPDLIFQPVYYSSYINDIVSYCKKHLNVPMIGYISDDCYTLKQFRLSPLYWIDRLYKRQKVKATIEQCDLLYVISEIQKEEYEKIFTPPCKVLTKCADFSKEAPEYLEKGEKIKLLYTGNLGKGRIKSLSYIADATERLVEEGKKIEFDIYSATLPSLKIRKAFLKKGCNFKGRVSYSQVLCLQEEADILVHAEGLGLKDRCEVHQSFSTKLVDYFALGKCIFAVGTYDEAFAKHLIDNDGALVATNKEEVYEKLKSLVSDRKRITDYGKKAYLCGKNHHDKEKIQKMLAEDIKKAVDSKNEGIAN